MPEQKFRKIKNIRDFKPGDVIKEIFVVKSKRPVQKYQSGFRFELIVGDSSGETTLRYWGSENQKNVEQLHSSIDKDQVILVDGEVREWKGGWDISVENDKLKVLSPEEYDIRDFIPITKKDIDKMYDELKEIISSIKNPELSMVLKSFFSDQTFVNKFKELPAGMYKHHGWIGGLLEHTLNVAKICQRLASIYPELDKDLLLTGAILHDSGKVKELELKSSIKYSDEGALKGHITIGHEVLSARLNEIGVSKKLAIKLSHMILSHHGDFFPGSPVLPAFPEALALHYADLADCRLNNMINKKNEALTGDDYVYTKDFGKIYLK